MPFPKKRMTATVLYEWYLKPAAKTQTKVVVMILIKSTSTCFHFAIQRCRTIKHQTFDLEKFIWLIPSNYGEAKPPAAFP